MKHSIIHHGGAPQRMSFSFANSPMRLISLITTPAHETLSQMIDFRGYHLHWRAVVSLHNHTLFLVDPFQLWLGNNCQYISVING
jgi:hypothetical protein